MAIMVEFEQHQRPNPTDPGRLSNEDIVDRTLNYLQNIRKDPFTNAVERTRSGDLDLLDQSVKLIKGAAGTLRILEEVIDNPDALGIGQAKVVVALIELLRNG